MSCPTVGIGLFDNKDTVFDGIRENHVEGKAQLA